MKLNLKSLAFLIGIILFMILGMWISGCNEAESQTPIDINKSVYATVLNNPNWQIVTIDKCEYVFYYNKSNGYSAATALTHKGNCKNHK